MKSLHIWFLYSKNSFLRVLTNRIFFLMFLFGKSVRIFLFLGFLFFLLEGTKGLAGYSKEQVIFFYLSYNLIDSASQLFFREVYRFRELVISGNLDLVLVKPVNPLLRVLLGETDLLDAIILVLIICSVLFFGINYISLNPFDWLIYVLLLANAFLISAAFHIIILGIGVLTTSIDHLVMVYRDLSSMLRIPVDIYGEPLRGLLTFVIPLGIMFTFPPKALMGLLSPGMILLSLIISVLVFIVSLKFWKLSLKQYSGAGS